MKKKQMIKLYTGPACSACIKLKARLAGLEITADRYEEANVNVPANRDEVIKLGFRGVPLLVRYDIDGEVVGALMGATKADSAYTDIFKGAWESPHVIHEPL